MTLIHKTIEKTCLWFTRQGPFSRLRDSDRQRLSTAIFIRYSDSVRQKGLSCFNVLREHERAERKDRSTEAVLGNLRLCGGHKRALKILKGQKFPLVLVT